MNGAAKIAPDDEAMGHDATMEPDTAGTIALVAGADGTRASAG